MSSSQQAILEKVVSEVIRRLRDYEDEPYVTVGVSNRHIHLSQKDIEVLFGQGYQLTKMKDLKQPGQYAAEETVTVIGPKGVLDKVRILGPARPETQVEISLSDSFKLGVHAPVRESGKTEGTPGIILKGPEGTVEKDHGVIVALRHIHMPPDFAEKFGLKDKDMVSVEVEGLRRLVYHNVLVRISDRYSLELHLDTDEANASGVRSGDLAIIRKGKDGSC